MTPEEFARVCRERARDVRRLPADVKRALKERTRPEIVEPLAAQMRAATTGPHAELLSNAVKPRTAATPELVIGGARPRLSGGGTPRDVVFGNEFGGGSRPRTRQFRRRHAFAFPTLSRNIDTVLDTYADIVNDTIEEAL